MNDKHCIPLYLCVAISVHRVVLFFNGYFNHTQRKKERRKVKKRKSSVQQSVLPFLHNLQTKRRTDNKTLTKSVSIIVVASLFCLSFFLLLKGSVHGISAHHSQPHRMFTGVVSWGDKNGVLCAKPQRPGVYTRVDVHVSWIKDSLYRDYAGLPHIAWQDIISNPYLSPRH